MAERDALVIVSVPSFSFSTKDLIQGESSIRGLTVGNTHTGFYILACFYQIISKLCCIGD
ncbi:hypothetical protein [Alkalihalophilus pseudofirmus]|uniref:hypothetical protein n=1 Tax=Alkalihalophilus pseudofirmus TaxID=79885 RepID=UPI0013051DF6|nr:hypothetical protein [Alkalihalophilus pseudofirmus]